MGSAACRPTRAVNANGGLPDRADHIIPASNTWYVDEDLVVDEITRLGYVVGYGSFDDYHDRTNGVAVALTLTENAEARSAAAFAGSVINSSGTFPSASGGLGALENGVANMTGGFAYFLTASDNGAINMSGGRTNFAGFNGSSTGNFGVAVVGNPSFPTSGTYLEACENGLLQMIPPCQKLGTRLRLGRHHRPSDHD